MARVVGSNRLGISLTIVGLALFGLASPVSASVVPAPGADSGTTLPPGWELCVLDGVGASVTPDNVANLDEWQVAEGGSTNNSAAYNPFNTKRMTDSNNDPIPAVTSSNGFPAFDTWVAGCSGTVTTLLQPNMAPIVSALKSGNVSPPATFLLDVDKSQWCAPSTSGIPCYASEILGGGATVTNALLMLGSGPLEGALTIFSDTTTVLSSYLQGVTETAADQEALATQTQGLVTATDEVSLADWELSTASSALRQSVLYDYTNSGRIESSDTDLQLFEPPSESGVLAQYFGQVATSAMIDRVQQAKNAVKAAISQRLVAATAVAQATSVLDSAETAENLDLSQLSADTTIIQAAGVCNGDPQNAVTPSPVVTAGTGVQAWVGALQSCLATLAAPASQ
jgi:hypothetical protein